MVIEYFEIAEKLALKEHKTKREERMFNKLTEWFSKELMDKLKEETLGGE